MANSRHGVSEFLCLLGRPEHDGGGRRAEARPNLLSQALTIAAVMLGLQALSAAAWADYRVQRGDVLQISIAGSPELQRRAMIDDDGKIYFPLIGELNCEGLTLPQIRESLRDQLIAKHNFENGDVTVDIAEYRPISVAGDVAQPGSYPYRPGMTVRDAVARAGGDRQQKVLDTTNARDQFGASRVTSVRLQIDVARLRAELLGRTEIDLSGLRSDAATARIAAEFGQMEAQQLKTEQQDYENENGYLTRVIKNTQDQVSALTAEQAQRESAVAEQQRQLARGQQLMQRSLIQMGRVEDEERILADSTGQLLEIKARAAQARRDLEDATRKLERLADQRKIDITQRLEAALGELATVEVSLQTAGREVRCLDGSTEGSPHSLEVQQIVIFRREGGDLRRIPADASTDLVAGDALEITDQTSPLLAGLAIETDLTPPGSSEIAKSATAAPVASALMRPTVRANGAAPCSPAIAARPAEPGEAKSRKTARRIGSTAPSPAPPAPAFAQSERQGQ